MMIVFWGNFLIVRRYRKSGVWHHRVPDFKLVYCGHDNYIPRKETRLAINERKGKLSAIVDDEPVAGSRLEQQKTPR